MAKGNPFLGFARGSVGDITLYRTNGEQIARARNRHPRNPNSDRQLYQRAVLATVSRIYQLGRAIFDHSFQGYRKGADNQRRFLKVNLNALRAQLAADISAGTSLARVAAPGIASPTANAYVISEGSYPQTLFTWSGEDSAMTISPASTSTTTVAQWAQEKGVIEGDIYTFVAIGVSPTDFAYEYVDDEGVLVEQASVGRARFEYLQLRVKQGVLTSPSLMVDSTWANLFDIYMTTSGQVDPTELASQVSFANLVGNPDWSNGCIGVIRSREDSDLRSSTTMQLVGDGAFGITAPWLLEVWRRESAIGGADVILEGSNFGPQVPPSYNSLTPGVYYVPLVIPVGSQTIRNAVVSVYEDNCDVLYIEDGGLPTVIEVVGDETDATVTVATAQQGSVIESILGYLRGKYSVTGSLSGAFSVTDSVPAYSTILGAL